MPIQAQDNSALGNFTIVANAAARPTGSQRYPGRLIFQADVSTFYWWNGATWVSLSTGGGGGGGDMLAANNLSDLTNTATARNNLGLGSSATFASSAFQPNSFELTQLAALTTQAYGRSLLTTASATAARTLLGVSTGTGDLVSTNNLSDLADRTVARTNLGLTDKYAPRATGVAATDTSNLTTFFASLTAGDRAIFPPDLYLISTGLKYPSGVFYQGTATRIGVGTVFKMNNSANLDALMASNVYYSLSASPNSEQWVEWRNCTFDGNRTNNTTGLGYAFVTMNFQSTFESLLFQNAHGDGMLMTNKTQAGNEIVNSCNEIYVNRCQSRSNDGNGFHLQDGTTPALTDGWLHNCITSSSQERGIWLETGAGWTLTNNHTYSALKDGIRVDKPYRCRIINNYVESFGGTSATAGTYCGINCSSGFIGTAQIIIANNTVHNTTGDVAANTRYGIACQTSTGSTAAVIIADNNVNGATGTIPTVGIRVINQATGTTTRCILDGNIVFGWDQAFQMGSAGTVKVAGRNLGTTPAPVTFNATPTLNAAQAEATGGLLCMTVTANITSATLTDGYHGQQLTIMYTQDATGGRTIAWPANVVSPPTTVTTANGVTIGHFIFNEIVTKWYSV